MPGWSPAFQAERGPKNVASGEGAATNDPTVMSRSASRSFSRWPFWLLIAAWVCANSPQAATYAVLTWLADARSFTHQQRLTVDVAFLLSGEKAPERIATAATATAAKLPPAVPADAVLKKLPLALERAAESLVAPMAPEQGRPVSMGWPDALRSPPLLGPPRTQEA
jgi:hypothetical protein